jgi:hypothetical protein
MCIYNMIQRPHIQSIFTSKLPRLDHNHNRFWITIDAFIRRYKKVKRRDIRLLLGLGWELVLRSLNIRFLRLLVCSTLLMLSRSLLLRGILHGCDARVFFDHQMLINSDALDMGNHSRGHNPSKRTVKRLQSEFLYLLRTSSIFIAYATTPQIPALDEPLRTEVEPALAQSLKTVWRVRIGISVSRLLATIPMKEVKMHVATDEIWGFEKATHEDVERERTVPETEAQIHPYNS